MKNTFKATAFLLMIGIAPVFAQQLAFPGAMGKGRFATGGRGAETVHVKNLNNDGEGSFREAVSKPNRTVVFDLGGVIKINSKVQVASNITILGQTAPGDGIVIYGDAVTFWNLGIELCYPVRQCQFIRFNQFQHQCSGERFGNRSDLINGFGIIKRFILKIFVAISFAE